MENLELWQQITILSCAMLAVLIAIAGMVYKIFTGTLNFREEIVFKPWEKEETEHVFNSTD